MQQPELSQEQSDRLAETIIDEVFEQAITECEKNIERQAAELANAKRELAEQQQARDGWRRERAFDMSVGERAIVNAQIADFSSPVLPADSHVRAVKSFLRRHPATRALPVPATHRRGLLQRLRRR